MCGHDLSLNFSAESRLHISSSWHVRLLLDFRTRSSNFPTSCSEYYMCHTQVFWCISTRLEAISWSPATNYHVTCQGMLSVATSEDFFTTYFLYELENGVTWKASQMKAAKCNMSHVYSLFAQNPLDQSRIQFLKNLINFVLNLALIWFCVWSDIL